MFLARRYALQLFAFALIVFLVTWAWALSHVESTIQIRATTEYVRFKTSGAHRAVWMLQGARVQEGFATETGFVPFEGTLEILEGADCVVVRRSLGPLKIECDGKARPVAKATEFPTGNIRVIHDVVAVEVSDLEDRARRGEPLALSVIGSVEVGQETVSDSLEPALLREGSVQLLGRSINRRDVYVGADTVLQSGDAVTLSPEAEAAGYVVIDESPGLRVVVRSTGRKADIIRFGSQEYQLTMSWVSSFRADTAFQNLCALLTILFSFISWVYGFVKGRAEKYEASRTTGHNPEPVA